MAFLRISLGQESRTYRRARRVVLRAPLMMRLCGLGRVRADEPRSPDAVGAGLGARRADPSAFRRRMRHYQREMREDLGYAFFIFSETDDDAARRPDAQQRAPRRDAGGVARLLARRRQHRARLHAEAVGAVATFAFERLRLHRLEAACLPHNAASIGVLEHCGFAREGLRPPLPQDQRRVAGSCAVRPPRATIRHAGGGAPAMSSARPIQPRRRRCAAARAAPAMLRAGRCWRCHCLCLGLGGTALASKPIVVSPDQDRVEITDARRVLRRPRRQPAGRDGAWRRRHRRAHVGARHDARHQSQLDRLCAAQPDRQADRALADGRALQRDRLRRRLARSRRAAHRGGDAVDRLRARAHQERPRRHLPHHARAGPDHHLRRRAVLRAVRAHLSLEAARLRAEGARPAAVQRHHSRAWPACWRSS